MNKTRDIVLLIAVVFLIAWSGYEAYGADAPIVADLPPITNVIPTDVWVDDNGQTFIVETIKNRVIIQDTDQEIVSTANITKPISVATDSQGRIFIGAVSGEVSVYDSEGKFIQLLDKVSVPIDITIDSNDRIYVVDNTESVVNIYDFELVHIETIAEVYHPMSVAVDNFTEEIVVLDKQQVYDSMAGRLVDGAGISWFDMNGTLLRTYFKFGYNSSEMDDEGKITYDASDGKMVNPQRITIDSLGRIYVTDSRVQAVMVYDNEDNWLSMIRPEPSLEIPRSVFVSKDNMLYITSMGANQINILSIDKPIVEKKEKKEKKEKGNTLPLDTKENNASFDSFQGNMDKIA